MPSGSAIRQVIRQLNHPLPARRREAVEQLSRWGPLAFEPLGEVAAGPDLEAAILARDLLQEMGEVLFVGAQVCLSVDQTRIRWNEPITLALEVHNVSSGKVRVPWPGRSDAAASQPAVDDARQVAAVMDVADFITVTDPAGEPVELRVDPIEQDTAVYRAVSVRASDNPPSHAIKAGESVRLAVPQFNRGWARFPMLEPGKYKIRFEYQPEWKDAAWKEQGFGCIRSNTVEIEVTEAAPAEVRKSDRPLKLLLSRQGDRMRGELCCTWDRELYLNLNIGGPLATHAMCEWVVRQGSQDADPFTLACDATGGAYDPEKLKLIAPGQSCVVTQAPVAQLRQHLPPAQPGQPTPTISLRYAFLSSPDTLRKALREKGRHESVPTQLFNGTVVSEETRLEENAE